MTGINLRVALSQKPLILDRVPRALKIEARDMLIDRGHILRCPDLRCDGLSALCPNDVDEILGVASVGAAGAWEWQCGHSLSDALDGTWQPLGLRGVDA